MEFQLLFALISASLLFLYTIKKHLSNSKGAQFRPKLPPGPRKVPVIGNLLQLRGALPHHSLRALAGIYGPVMHLQLGEISAVIISSAEAAKEVMKTHDIAFSNRPELLASRILFYNCTGIISANYGDYWRMLRKICLSELLSAKRVQSFGFIREEEVGQLIRSVSLSGKSAINMTEKFFSMTNTIVSRAAFGHKCKHQQDFIQMMKEISTLASGFMFPDIFPSLKFLHPISNAKAALEKIHKRLDGILENIINEHRADRSTGKVAEEDLVDVLLKLQESSDLEVPITTENIKAIILPLCHVEERMALLRFREGFEILKTASHRPSAYPKILSWKLQGDGSADCCSWEGVYCDQQTGHVDGLDLSSSFLYGSIDSESSLFSLSYLRSLNLADNHFNYSLIPSKIASLSRLSYLNLSSSVFSGQIPSEILKLSNLTSLDLSFNVDFSSQENLLKLETHDLRSLAGNLTHLRELNLSMVNISSAIPDSLTSLLFLSALGLRKCGLYGEIPIGIFLLPDLRILDVGKNRKLRGHVPEIVDSSLKLEELRLDYTDISGKLPDSIMKLKSLRILDINYCLFSGFIPATISNMTTLTTLDLSRNYISGKVPSLASMSQLSYLSLAHNNFTGKISTSFANLTSLTHLDLGNNKFSGIVPSWFMNLTHLTHLDLSYNTLQGSVPTSLSQIENLEYLNLFHANLSGIVEVDIFLRLKKLTHLKLSQNYFSVVENNQTNITLPQFKYLALSGCKIKKFPHFLRFQDELEDLFLDSNQIEGLIPEWIWNKSRGSMDSIWLGGNQLTGFDNNPAVLPWTRLRLLDLEDNMMQGSLPVPPASTLTYFASDNRMTGEISPLICNAKSLILLQLSYNNLVGEIPSCLGNFSNDLMILNLKANNFRGVIPEMSPKLKKKVSNLITFVDLSSNKFAGNIPDSIGSFSDLQSLNLSNNFLSGSIPKFTENLTALESFDISRNNLTGKIPPQLAGLGFLAYFDVSFNRLTGPIPQGKQFDLFQNDSYKGNMALCGPPLSKKCGKQAPLSPPLISQEDDDSNSFLNVVGVIIASIGFGSGLIGGIIYGDKLATKCYMYITIRFLSKYMK
uniref:Leucine-rich repeat-containing N-terminal plant-type domain-containing protein n=1 Tax=Daucus carota subsp. sativus TaxID=79200 RepID=A0A165Z8N3_DAUCS